MNEDVQFDVNRTALATDAYSAVRRWQFDTNAMAYYVSDTMRFMDDRLTITPGIRYEDVRTDYMDQLSAATSDNDATAWLPGLTLGLQATDKVFLFANAQRSLVPVQTAQVVREGQVANETAWNYELGSRWQPLSSVELSATLFRTDYQDQIQFNKTLNIYENLGETRQQGIELESRWQATEALALGLGYTLLDTEQLSGANKGKELPNAPRHHISTDASYKVGDWTATATALYAAKSFSDAANTTTETRNGSAGELPAYTLVNTRLGRDFSLGGGSELNLGVGINNLLDEDAYFRGSDVSPVGRVPLPGRTYMLEGQLKF